MIVTLLALSLVSPPPAYEPVRAGEVKFADGEWAERVRVNDTATIPSMSAIMETTKYRPFLENFRIAAGEKSGKHDGAPWNDGDTYKWLEALAATYARTKDAGLDRQMDDAIAVIAKAQRADGYLHTPVLIANRNGDASRQPFRDRLNFEMYNFGHLFTAACLHHEVTGKPSFLNVAIKAADCLIRTFEIPSPELSKNNVCPSHYMGIIDLYRHTRDAKYLTLAKKLFALRELTTDGTDDNQDRLPFREQRQIVGHAVRANYLMAGAADLLLETGDESLRPALEACWKNLVTRKLAVTGGCGALFDGASPEGIKDQKSISRIHQAYGRDYQMPLATAHNETCAAIGLVLWADRMGRLTGDAKYADAIETAMLNAVLAGVSRDGTKYFYTNALRQLNDHPAPLRWSRHRESFISCFCCPPNVARIIARSGEYAFGKSKDGLWVNQFSNCSVRTTLPDGRVFAATMTTDFPWDGKVSLTIDEAPAGDATIRLRIPAWVKSASVSMGKTVEPVKPGTYHTITRAWTKGDRVMLDMTMAVRMLEANPFMEETRNHVAITRGPIVYCLESPDLPKDTRVLDVRVADDSVFKPVSRKDRVTTLVGPGTVVDGDRWANELYREKGPAKSRPLDLTLVPYSTWANRGRSEMTVWLPLGR